MEGCDELNKNIIKHNDMEAVDFINSLTNKEYNRIRHSHGDAECRRLLKEHLLKQSSITAVVQVKPEKVCICNQIIKSRCSGFCPKCNTDWL